MKLSQLIELLASALGKKVAMDRQPPQPDNVPIPFADASKARKKSDFNATTKTAQGILKSVEWFQSGA